MTDSQDNGPNDDNIPRSIDASLPLQHWRLQTDDDNIAWLHLSVADSGANVLSRPVLNELNQCLDEIEKQSARALIIASDKGSGFIAGADIREFTRFNDEQQAFEQIRQAQNIFDRLAALRCPSVAIIHGFCLGGGTELALACRYRVALDDPSTRIGLPEVRLGIHPGFGGSVRLPPLIGALAAMDMMLTGRSLSARSAAKLGLVNDAAPARHLLHAARTLALTAPTPTTPSWLKRLPGHGLLRPLVAPILRRRLGAHARAEHYPAPYALIDLWQRYADQPNTMMVEEARSVAHLMQGDTAQNLIRLFFLQEQLKSLGRRVNFKAARVHVIGAGAMGGDIAAWCALRGLHTTLQDQTPERVAPAIKRAFALFQKKLRQPRLVQAAMDRLLPDTPGHGLANADVVIEAIFENLEAKQKLFRDIEGRMRPDAILATNTSSIPLEQMGQNLMHPDRLVGLHFFNPVAKMQLVEVVCGHNTAAETVDRAAAFTRQIDRLPLMVRSTPGFLVNRVLMPYLLEAVTLLQEGVPADVIDAAAVKFGMPVGPIELADTVGLDVCLSVAEILAQQLGGTVPEPLRKQVQDGRYGRKSGAGFFKYDKKGPIKPKSRKDYQPPDDIEDRLILRLLNEAQACLREGVVSETDLVDAGLVFGTGFAPFRGGPLHYAEHRGVDTLLQTFERLRQRYGERFKPDIGWTLPSSNQPIDHQADG